MTNPSNWAIATNAQEYLRGQEKRLGSEERRPIVRKASDILGPGFGPYAIETFDWNSIETAFNGFWFSQAGAANAPDAIHDWVGHTIGRVEGAGIQVANTYRAVDWPTTTARRAFDTLSGGGRQYTDWVIDTPPVADVWHYIGTAGEPAFMGTWTNYGGSYDNAAFTERNGIIYLKGLVKSGTVNTLVFTLPVAYRPVSRRIFATLGAAVTSGAASTGTAHTHDISDVGARVNIFVSGDVVPQNSGNAYVSLDGISYPKEN